MPPKKKISKLTKVERKQVSPQKNVCFVISPIGKEGTEQYRTFKEVLDFIIKPAFEVGDFNLEVLRADDINRSGSFIKDILENIYSSYIVIADLTGQNPNVFYELGVRHSLRPRTILIAQTLDDIPSDLREYRTIIYDTSAKGAALFSKKMNGFIREIKKEPERSDNPVLDRLGSVIENKLAQVESERDQLKKQLTDILSGKGTVPKTTTSTNVVQRFERILSLRKSEVQGSMFGGKYKRGNKSFQLPASQGNFNLYFLQEGDSIKSFWYVSKNALTVNVDDKLADIRVLMELCSKGQDTKCEFIIVTGTPVDKKNEYYKKFNKIKSFVPKDYHDKFELYILDPPELEKWEKAIGLKA